jgi:hypothetical protein
MRIVDVHTHTQTQTQTQTQRERERYATCYDITGRTAALHCGSDTQ